MVREKKIILLTVTIEDEEARVQCECRMTRYLYLSVIHILHVSKVPVLSSRASLIGVELLLSIAALSTRYLIRLIYSRLVKYLLLRP